MKTHKDWAYVLRHLCSVLLVVIIFVTLLQVFYRFVLDSPLTWTDELSRFLLVWMVFLGTGIVSFDDKHLKVNLIQEYMPAKIHLITTLIMRAVIVIFLAIVIYTSIEVVMVAHYQKTGALEIPFSFWRAAAPVGSLLMIIYTFVRSFNDIKDYKAGSYNDNDSIGEELDQ